MAAPDFWKNFRLGEEVHIAGSFIYNGLRRFHELELLDHSDEVFEFLYDLSVRIERLLKIAVVLNEHVDGIDQEALEKSLITHNHLDLLKRLRKHAKINFGKSHIDLLQLLSTFYKTHRYDRFSINSVLEGKKESVAIVELISKHLNIAMPEYRSLFGTRNEDQYRKFMRRTVLKISQVIYEIIDNRATKLGLYTYELRYESKAASVFLREIDIADEDMLWKELLIFFMNADASTAYLKHMKSIEPLNFDSGLVGDYLDCFKARPPKAAVMDELEHHYENLDPEERKKRFLDVGAIGKSNVYFNDNDSDNEEDEDDL